MSALIRCCLSRAIVDSPMTTKNGHAPGSASGPIYTNIIWKIRALATRRDLVSEALEQGIQGKRPEILAAAGTHGHRFGLHFLIADDQLVRQLLQAMFSNFIGYFLITQIGRRPETSRLQRPDDPLGVGRRPDP